MLMAEWKLEDALDFRYNEGIGIGREEGALQEKRETARKLKFMGLPTRQITEATGLAPEDIERL